MITIKDITPEQYSTYVGVLTIEDKDNLVGQWSIAISTLSKMLMTNG
jgi:hypothetical protein